MTIEQSAEYAAVQHTGKRLMMRLGMPFRNDLIALRKAVNVQTFLIRWAAAKANACWRILLLK
jgi:hypothetical protein